MKKIALVDLDGCLVRYDDTMIPLLKKMESPQEKGLYDYSDCWLLQDKFPHIEERMSLIMSKQGFWTGLAPYESGLRLYDELIKHFKVYILTKAVRKCSLSWKEKVDWLHKWIGLKLDEIMVVTNKEQVMGDLLYDDLPENGHKWLKNNPKGRVLMPIRRYNIERIKDEPRIVAWDDSPKNLPINSYGDCIRKIDFGVPKMVIEQVLGNKLERGFDYYN